MNNQVSTTKNNRQNNKKRVSSVKPNREQNGRFAKNTPTKLHYGAIYRVQERDRNFVARLRQRTINEHVVVDVLGKPMCILVKKLRVASLEEVNTYLSLAKKNKNAWLPLQPFG